MNINDIELKLLAAMPVEIDGVGKLVTPTLREIIEIGEDRYLKHLSTILFSKDNFDETFDEDVTDFELIYTLCFQSEEFREILFDSIKFFFKDEARLDHDGQDVFFVLGQNGRLDKYNFWKVQEIIRISNWAKKTNDEPDYTPGNEQARQFIEKLKILKKSAPKIKPKKSMHSIINAMSWRANALNLLNIFDLTIYQLYLGFSTIENIDNYSYTLHGVYTGNVDAKKIKLDQIHWANILQNK